jgi:hypothetical protein
VLCPSPVGIVLDLRGNVLAVAGECPRTDANETEMETARVVASSWDDVFSLCNSPRHVDRCWAWAVKASQSRLRGWVSAYSWRSPLRAKIPASSCSGGS